MDGGAGAGPGPGDLGERDRSAEQEEDTTNCEDVNRTATKETATAAGTVDRSGAGTTGGVMRGGCEAEDRSGHGVDLPDAHQSSK